MHIMPRHPLRRGAVRRRRLDAAVLFQLLPLVARHAAAVPDNDVADRFRDRVSLIRLIAGDRKAAAIHIGVVIISFNMQSGRNAVTGEVIIVVPRSGAENEVVFRLGRKAHPVPIEQTHEPDQIVKRSFGSLQQIPELFVRRHKWPERRKERIAFAVRRPCISDLEPVPFHNVGLHALALRFAL